MRTNTKVVSLISFAVAGPHGATDVTPQLDLSLSLSTTTVAQSAVVEVTVTVANRTARVVPTANPGSYACIPPYIVTDASGRPVVLPGRICTAIGYLPIELAPGASVVIRDRWAVDAADGLRARKVDAGQYRLRGRVQGAGQELLSAPVTVTVTP